MKTYLLTTVFVVAAFVADSPSGNAQTDPTGRSVSAVHHRTEEVDGLDIFYREAGPVDGPTIVLLHGFPTSSHMFRDLIPLLSDRYHLIAPDYPGYGNSSMPSVDKFDYTFDNIAGVVERLLEKKNVNRYSLYLMDYGAPVGFRIAVRNPDQVESLIIQNGNAYDEGLDNDFWEPIKEYWKDRSAINKGMNNPFWANIKTALGDPNLPNEQALRFLVTSGATQWQYTTGVRDVTKISPDAWDHDQARLDRPGNVDIQLQLFYDYGSNPSRYAAWQAYFREYQPPALVIWGKNDEIFPVAGAHPYGRDLKQVEMHFLDTGHFALEEDGAEIAAHIRRFLGGSCRVAGG